MCLCSWSDTAGLQQLVKNSSHLTNASERVLALPWGEAELTAGSLFTPVESQTAGALIREQPSAWGVERQRRDVRGWGRCPARHCRDWCRVCPSLIWSEYREMYFGLRGLKQQEPLPEQLTWGGCQPFSGGRWGGNTECHCSELREEQHLEEDNEEDFARCSEKKLWSVFECNVAEKRQSADWFPVCSMK